MNNQQRAAMQMALEALEKFGVEVGANGKVGEAITALRSALQEHALQTLSDIHQEMEKPQESDIEHYHVIKKRNAEVVALETAQPQGFRSLNDRIAELEQDPEMKAALDRARDRFANAGKLIEPSEYDREFWVDKPQGTWIDLTDSDIDEAICEEDSNHEFRDATETELARSIITKFKEKNTPPVVPHGCSYCNSDLFAGTKCNNCGKVFEQQGEPMAWGVRTTDDYLVFQVQRQAEHFAETWELHVDPLYTAPPSVEAVAGSDDDTDKAAELVWHMQAQIEAMRIETLEKAAKFFDDNDTKLFWGSQAAAAIRSMK